MTIRPRSLLLLLTGVTAMLLGPRVSAQTSPAPLSVAYGRSVVDIQTAHASPGGVFAATVRGGRWSSANTLLDGRRGALAIEGGRLFGLIPLALDTEPGEHKLSLFFPGGRRGGGAVSMMVSVPSIARPTRARILTPEDRALSAAQTALGHGRFLLAAIRSRELKNYQTGPLRAPVEAPITFPFGGFEDFGVEMGPLKDGLIGEHHRGVDYEVAAGTQVKAPGAGVVLLARSLVFSGETLVIGHGHGLVSVLSHLTHVTAHEGEMVEQGALVGTSGKTGLGAFSPHVCFSVYLHSINVDPEAVMDASLFPAGR